MPFDSNVGFPQANVGDEAEVDAMFAKAVEEFGTIDVSAAACVTRCPCKVCHLQ